MLFGNSLVLSGLQASLGDCPWLDVIGLGGSATVTELLALNPSVVIYDMGSVQSEYLLTQLQAQPGLLMIGVDPESHEVLFTGQEARSITLDQIVQIVRNR